MPRFLRFTTKCSKSTTQVTGCLKAQSRLVNEGKMNNHQVGFLCFSILLSAGFISEKPNAALIGGAIALLAPLLLPSDKSGKGS